VNELDIFSAALDLPSLEKRAHYLDEACGDNWALRRRIEELLASHAEVASFMKVPAPAELATVDDPIIERPGTVIGPYELLEQIGEGGFGVVFMAEQSQPIRRKVALKVLKPGMDTKQVIARFEAERQALALMDHPNIAKVLDAGQTSSGRPYFVMDLVKGLPITEYCDQSQFTPRERLELFSHVCQAVQHAHQKGIIHRDIKPSNVLVTRQDGASLVKVIDFGIAKALGQQLTDKTVFTGFAQLIGSPLYMSPEQAALSNVDVDTRSDIYSLGVLLYELLTGTTPFDQKRFKEAGYDEMRRIIREEEPPRPSTRISTLGQAATTISKERKSDPGRLSQLFRGELDWIVIKALSKDRNQRYESASAFAADVQHYLNNEPVQACPPSSWYRFRKFVRRNRGPVLAASLVLLALVAGVIGTSVGLLRTKQAQQTSQRRLLQVEKANEILGSIFKGLHPEAVGRAGKPLQVVLGERLDQATAQLEGEVIGDPLAVARMQMTLGESQLGLGYAQKAILLFSKARTTFTDQLGLDDPDTLTSMNFLALGYLEAGQLNLALPLFEETLERRKTQLGPDHHDTIESMNNLALGYVHAEKHDQAVALFEETLKRMKANCPPDDPDTLMVMNNLGMSYYYQGGVRLDLALPLLKDTFNRRKRKLGPDDPDTLQSMNNLALALQAAGKLDLALPLYQETLKRRRAKLGPEHTDTLVSMNNLAWGYEAANKHDEAAALYEETLKMMKSKLSPEHPKTVTVLISLGREYIRAGQPAKAEPFLRDSLAIREKQGFLGDFYTKSWLGAALADQKKYSQAEQLLLAGYQGMKEHQADFSALTKSHMMEVLQRLVRLYEATGKPDKAKEWQKKLAMAKAAATPAAK